jgi:hypothetical protein
MYLKVLPGHGLQLEDRDNFRSFKLVVEARRDQIADICRILADTAELPNHETAWVFETALRKWPGVEFDDEWQQSLTVMIDKARPHGWIDDTRKAIKAHVEWLA